MPQPRRLLAPALLVIAAGACGSDGATAAARRTVALHAPQAALTVGDYEAIVVAVTGTADSPVTPVAVAWESRQPLVATVSANGVVKALSPGTATIVARVPGGEGTVSVVVTPSPLSITGRGDLPDRYMAEVWVRGATAYTTTWGRRGLLTGNTLHVWNITSSTPSRLAAVTVADATTLGDVQTTDDGRTLVVAMKGSSGGIALFDLANPLLPVEVSRFVSANTLGEAHTAEVARLNGRQYAFLAIYGAGTDPSRLVIVDITDVTAPREVTVLPMGNPIVHDVHVRDGVMFTALWNDGLRIWDIGGGGKGGSVANPVPLGELQTIGGDVHNSAWFKDSSPGSSRYLFVGEEGPTAIGSSSSGDIHVVDISDLSKPREVAFFHVDGAGTHNFSLDEGSGVLYAAYYNGGVRALDIRGDLGTCEDSQRATDGRCDLRRMGRSVGVALTGGSPVFVWGVHWQDGVLYASDMLNGLWRMDVSSLRRP